MNKTLYLEDKDGYVIAKIEPEESRDPGFIVKVFSCLSWDEDHKPYEYDFHSRVMCKWDGCSHWWFDGQEIDADYPYYHFHLSGFENFIVIMAFVWKSAMDYWTQYYKKEKGTLEYVITEYQSDIVNYILKDYTIVTEEKIRVAN